MYFFMTRHINVTDSKNMQTVNRFNSTNSISVLICKLTYKSSIMLLFSIVSLEELLPYSKYGIDHSILSFIFLCF